MKEPYLQSYPTDSEADLILVDMLPDYKAEIRRNARFRNAEPDWTSLPVVTRTEEYLKKRLERNCDEKPSRVLKYRLVSHFAGEQVICGQSDDLDQLANKGWELYKASPLPRISSFAGNKELIRFTIFYVGNMGDVTVARLGWHLVDGLSVPFSTGAFPSVSYKHPQNEGPGVVMPQTPMI